MNIVIGTTFFKGKKKAAFAAFLPEQGLCIEQIA